MIERIVLPTLHALRRHAGPVREEKLGFEETRRGDTLHAVLAQLEFVEGNLIDCVDAALARTGIPEAGRAEARRLLVAFLADSGILAYFQHAPGRRVMNEQEFTNRSGDLFRADRVVVDDAGVTVIDYKTGGQHDEEQYRTQISNYMDIAGEVLGARNVTGCIAYVDLKKLAYVVPGRTEERSNPMSQVSSYRVTRILSTGCPPACGTRGTIFPRRWSSFLESDPRIFFGAP